MVVDYIKKFKSVDCKKILFQNRNSVNEKVEKLIEGGYDKLQIICDFDKTLTKQHVDGKRQYHAFDLLKRCPSVPQEVAKIITELNDKYSVLDKDPTLSHAERNTLMAEWWNKSIDAYKGLSISQEEIDKICLEIGPPIRDNAKDFFDTLTKGKVPVLLFSAGIGEFLEPLLKNAGITGSNIELVTNWLKRDKEGRIEGFQASAIHTVNKNEYDIENSEFYQKIADRPNVILLGDHLGDADMANSLKKVDTIIKIGFSYGEAEVVLPTWLNTFDIVIEDDQTMNVPRAIIQLIDNV